MCASGRSSLGGEGGFLCLFHELKISENIFVNVVCRCFLDLVPLEGKGLGRYVFRPEGGTVCCGGAELKNAQEHKKRRKK